MLRYELGRFVNPESADTCIVDSNSMYTSLISQYDSLGNELTANFIHFQYEANKQLPKLQISRNENSGRSLANTNYNRNSGRRNPNLSNQYQRAQPNYDSNHNDNSRTLSPQNRVLNCEQTAVCDIIINNTLQEAFKIVIHPMAEVRFIESIRNGTHVNIDSIQPSSIWISPRSKRNRVSFLCLPGGIGKGF